MSSATEEHVLAVPTTIFHQLGPFVGLSTRVEHYLPALLAPAHLFFLPRGQAEADPAFKQIIPYVVLKCGTRIFHYQRGKAGGEKRLHALRSIGVGGHINPEDHETFASTKMFDEVYRQGMLREVHEEVILDSSYRETVLGLINDDRTPVGQVHLGIVHVFELDTPRVERREATLTNDGFASIADLIARKEEFETWSQFTLEALHETTLP